VLDSCNALSSIGTETCQVRLITAKSLRLEAVTDFSRVLRCLRMLWRSGSLGVPGVLVLFAWSCGGSSSQSVPGASGSAGSGSGSMNAGRGGSPQTGGRGGTEATGGAAFAGNTAAGASAGGQAGLPSSLAGAAGEAPDSLEPVPSEPLPREPALDARFVKITLHRDFLCEGASFGDFNRDGATDVVAGPEWYEGPGYGTRHALWPRTIFNVRDYADCFFEWVYDFNGDEWPDVLMVGFPGAPAAWFENPRALDVPWPRHDVIVSPVDNESPEFVDITGDGVPELVHMSAGSFGWSAPDSGGAATWPFHPFTEQRGYGAFTHGLGVGDLDGDGRADALESSGYFIAPEELTDDALWQRRDQPFGAGGAQMPVVDLDGDGDADVVVTQSAHGYGLSWFEQTTTQPAPAFTEHVIVPSAAPASDADVIMHEPHAVAVADIDGDGIHDIVGGERHWGHIPGGDADFDTPGRLYWFRTERGDAGVTFEPSLIDDDSGVGTQLTVGDLDDNGSVDIVISNKKGAFVFLQVER
jgi:hypothetical protein